MEPARGGNEGLFDMARGVGSGGRANPRQASLFRIGRGLLFGASLALGLTTAAQAVPIPKARPAPPPPSELLSEADGHAFWEALDARESGNWVRVLQLSRQITDPTARDVLTWLRAYSGDTGASLSEIVAFQNSHPDWPKQEQMSLQAERALTDYPMSDADVISWFLTREPATGEGKIRLGLAHINSGRTDEGSTWIQRAWIENQFSRAREREILRDYAQYLPPQAHEDRLERLIWETRFTDARRMLQLVNTEARAIADARILLATRARNAENAISRVPAALRQDPGLLFDQARYHRRRGQEQTALPLLLRAPTQPDQLDSPGRWWTERKIMARKAIAEGQYMEAYGLALGHGHESGVSFAEGEFMAGWIALQYLNQPNVAAVHFQTLSNGVRTPISRARGAYWQGRAAEAQGRAEEAMGYYEQATQFPATFYGQLAQAQISQGQQALLELPDEANPTAGHTASLEANPQVIAFKLLDEAGESGLALQFVKALAGSIDDPSTLAALADMMVAHNKPNYSVRVAKIAAGRGILLPERSYPTTAVLPTYRIVGNPVEPALVYGLSRQESEFNPQAVSHAGARGLMQLMPGTARAVARQISVPYRRSSLTDDPAYNAMLGSAHLGDLLDDFAGSYIMTIAAYNAGAHRVSQWVERFGDPRDPAIDPIDWVENIPFTETRNYVQRVLENVQVYRTRLAGQATPLRIEQDLARYDGSAPIIYPARPTPPTPPAPVATANPVTSPPAQAVAAVAPARSDVPRPNPIRPATPAIQPSPVQPPVRVQQTVQPQPAPVTAAIAPASAPVLAPGPAAPANVEAAMQPVFDAADEASRNARGLAIPARTAPPAQETAPTSTAQITPAAPLVPVPGPASTPEVRQPQLERAAPVLQPVAPQPVTTSLAPVRLTPPRGLDTPRPPSNYTQAVPDIGIEQADTPALERGQMMPIPDYPEGG